MTKSSVETPTGGLKIAGLMPKGIHLPAESAGVVIVGRVSGVQARSGALSLDPQSERPHRVAISIPALLTTSDNHTFPVIVRDISAQGFRVELSDAEELLVGEQIHLLVEGKEHYSGQVRWVAGREAGAAFLRGQLRYVGS